MFCPKCGKEVQEGSSFCGNCGASLGDKAANAAGGVGAQNADSGAPASNAAASVAGSAAAAGAAKKSGKKKKGPIAIVAAIVVIVIVAVIGVNVFGGASGVAVKDSTEAYTWDELSKISDEIAKTSDEDAAVEVAKKYHLTTADGKLDGTQTKSVTLSNGTQTAAQIVGFVHDEKTDGGKAGITFIFKDCMGRHYMNSNGANTGGWEASEMRSYLNSEGLNMLPADLKQEVVAVNKLTNNVGQTQDASSVTNTADQLWLFSYVELGGNVNKSDFFDLGYAADIFNAEGSEYKLFRDMNVNPTRSNSILMKNLNGLALPWWGRSPNPPSSYGFEYVFSDGIPGYAGANYYAENTLGVCPGFCI